MAKKFDLKALDSIFNDVLEKMESSKQDVFVISEKSRQSYENMKDELEDVRTNISRVIKAGDLLEEKTRAARRRLAEVSQFFNSFSESEVRQAYEQANELQVQLSVNRSEEKQYRQKRDRLQRRLQTLLQTIERAEELVNRLNVTINYLASDHEELGEAIDSVKLKQDYSLRIIEAQEEERKRLSREIHDGPAQMMANVLLRSDLIERTYREKGPEPAFKEISSLKEMVRDALTEVRRIIYDLRPMALDDLGLVPTLKKYLETTEDYNKGTRLHFHTSGKEVRLPGNYETAIFRLVQEAVSNAIRHGKATVIDVKVEWLKDHVTLVVKDNGSGFDQSIVKSQSFGLIGMKERIDLIDGDFYINSSLGNGTVLMFQIPLETD
ncbi:sensor histidine kinase [Planococcus shenhongbingii]|uniref:Signal transduction histidine-protein kinase/phosphatase DegS n=1 Tax=Planococcus shenhongbingii TaxID=3058398 RepID=A0ABT8N981_9BACL|nr:MULTISPECIES: sensor histidine kinase [unclassified Planococcus (in: firmicutes)]MDN7244449.1 sensor histidine kinase [Planococcus sp. N017]WKA57611.1 sensor histidine kinase [Planococcus sp. N016]